MKHSLALAASFAIVGATAIAAVGPAHAQYYGAPPPGYDAPRYEGPRYDGPRYDGPRYDGPRDGEPRYGDPRYGRPEYEPPGYVPPGRVYVRPRTAFGTHCDAVLRTPAGPQRLVCDIIREKPLGEACACPPPEPPPGYAPGPYVGGRTIR